MYIDINTSRARKTFKRLLGHTNHYLITILVGLDYIKDPDINLPEEFRTSWNPRNNHSSSIRSREFAINASLSWAIDALDAYLSFCHKKPTLYQEKEIQDNAGGAGQFVFSKFIVLRDYVNATNEPNFKEIAALAEVAIQWRNRLVHYFADNQISPETRQTLFDNPNFFLENFQGLNINELLERFDGNQAPRFKEITSLIRGIHKFVEISDVYLLGKIDKELHLIECIDFHLKLNTESESDLKKKIGKTYNLPLQRRINSMHQIIMNYGFTLIEKQTNINEDWILNLSNLTFSCAMKFLNEIDYAKKKQILINGQ